MASNYKSDMYDAIFKASGQRVSEKNNSSWDIDHNADLLTELHRQIDRWIKNCRESWVDQEAIEDLTMLKIMIESWMNSNPTQTINDRIH